MTSVSIKTQDYIGTIVSLKMHEKMQMVSIIVSVKMTEKIECIN